MGKLFRNQSVGGAQTPTFSKSQVKHMEKLLLEKNDSLLDRSFYEKITADFNDTSGNVEGRCIQIEQVKNWFEDKQIINAIEVPSSPDSSVKDFNESDASLSNDELESYSSLSKDGDNKAYGVEDVEFEAKSSKDDAWYDVAMFLSHRVVSDELEVRVRYHGFDAEEDEWVNVKEAVRVRSIPLESSECRKVQVGDLVLCFRENNEEATHFDAHVIEIERKLHDIRGCQCLFLIRYDHDSFEEKVRLRKMCRRP